MTCYQIVTQYPNFFRIHAGGGPVGWRHDVGRSGYILITQSRGPGLPSSRAKSVYASRCTSKDRLLEGKIIPLEQLEKWIDKQLGFK